ARAPGGRPRIQDDAAARLGDAHVIAPTPPAIAAPSADVASAPATRVTASFPDREETANVTARVGSSTNRHFVPGASESGEPVSTLGRAPHEHRTDLPSAWMEEALPVGEAVDRRAADRYRSVSDRGVSGIGRTVRRVS